MKTKVSNSQAGFSLLELMVVVAIVGVLATIAVPNFQRFQAKSRAAEAKNNLSAYFSAAKASYSEWNMYLGNFVAIGFRPEGRLGYRVTAENTAVMPTGYTGPDEPTCISTGAAAADCDQPATDGAPWISAWTENLTGVVVPDAPMGCAPNTDANAFVACASGRHQLSPVVDTWQIDERKRTQNTMAGI